MHTCARCYKRGTPSACFSFCVCRRGRHGVSRTRKPQRVIVEGPAGLLKKYTTRVKNGTLSLGRGKRWLYIIDQTQEITVYITVECVEAVALSGAGEVLGRGVWKSKALSLLLHGSGDLRCDVQATEVAVDLIGSGNMYIQGTSEDIAAHLSGSGNIKLQGIGKDIAANIDGSGDVDALQLKALRSDVFISGSGTCSLHVQKTIKASIHGKGKVLYRGKVDDDEDVDVRISGTGKVRRIVGNK